MFILLFGFIGSVQTVAAADITAGKQAAANCVSCHGANGISSSDNYPNLAGQKAGYLEKQMKDFKSKQRIDPVMNAMTAGLTEQQIANIAAYYSTIK